LEELRKGEDCGEEEEDMYGHELVLNPFEVLILGGALPFLMLLQG